MKRDWDVIREILSKIEDMDCYTSFLSISDFNIDAFEERYLISNHMKLLISRGLVDGTMHPPLGNHGDGFSVRGLTWEGHEFLDAIRSDTVWNKTKETITSRGLDMSFETIKVVASAAVTSILGLSA